VPRGKKAPWSDDGRILQNALDLARRPFNASQAAGYAQAIETVQQTLDTLNRLKGDELRRFAGRHFVSKPVLAQTIKKLSELQRRAQQHFRRTILRSPGPGTTT
jgi:hypothetical protein